MSNTILIPVLLLSFTLSYADSVNDEITSLSTFGAVDRFYVGSDNACDFSTIQAAINAANNSQNPAEIRVADNKAYHENIVVNLNNVLIDGSYASCADAINDINGGNKVKLYGAAASSNPSIRITGLFVVIKGIQIQGNDNGGIFANETSVITLENLLFFQLGSRALSVSGDGQINVLLKNSLFLLNSGSFGGALYCTGSNHSIEMTEDSGFAGNVASASGGAVWLASGCDFSMTDGGFENNSSAGNGGAMAAINSDVILKNVNFSNNETNAFGGAISILNAFVQAEATKFTRNEAGAGGGAIELSQGSIFTLERSTTNCLNKLKCNYFDGNKAPSGGAISIASSVLIIEGTFFENNRADKGTVLRAFEGSGVNIEGSVFNRNGNQAANGFDDLSVISVKSDSVTNIKFSTFADNHVLFSTFKQEDQADLNIYSSIIFDSDSGDVFGTVGSNTTLNPNCLIVHEAGSANNINANITEADPMFIDPANGDYHINAELSPAVDYCSALPSPQYRDIDNEVRGFDDPTIANNPDTNGTYDIGADETYSNDIIFKNTFE